MASKRMLTKKVTDDDNFLSLSSSAQALYLHLMMSADDDGFSNQVSLSMFKAHASVQDLQALLENRYIYQFENGVVVIKHWRMANALRKDRYTPTVFQEEFAKLGIKDNGAYTWLPNGCQMVAPEKNSIGKDSIDKVNKGNKDRVADNTLDVIDSYDFDEETKEVIKDWIKYKQEKRQGYKEMGLKSFVKQVHNKCQEYGFKSVREVIEKSMSSNYQGVVWDWLNESAKKGDRNARGVSRLSANDEISDEESRAIYDNDECPFDMP